MLEELHHVGEGEHGVQFVFLRFLDQRFHQPAAHAVGLGMLVDRQRADLAERGAVEVQRAAAQQLARRAVTTVKSRMASDISNSVRGSMMPLAA